MFKPSASSVSGRRKRSASGSSKAPPVRPPDQLPSSDKTKNCSAPKPGERITIGMHFFDTFPSDPDTGTSCRVAYCFPDQPAPKAIPITNWPAKYFGQATRGDIRLHSNYSPCQIPGITTLTRGSPPPFSIPRLATELGNGPPAAWSKSSASTGIISLFSKIWDCIVLHIRVLQGKSLETIPNLRKSVAVRAPDGWSEKARSLLGFYLQESDLARGCSITYLSDLQAEIITSIHLPAVKDDIRVGDLVMTIDLREWQPLLRFKRIVQLEPHIEINETAMSEDSCASSTARVRRLCRKLLGDNSHIFIKMPRFAPEEFLTQIKSAFCHPSSKGGDKDGAGFLFSYQGRSWETPRETLNSAFRPFYNLIQRLANAQMESRNREYKAILLVGDIAGQSPYLYEEMRTRYPDPWVIQIPFRRVVEGVALSQAPVIPARTAERATLHYGTEIRERYNPEVDVDVPVFEEPYTKMKTVDRMNWFLHIGDDISKEREIKIPYCRILHEHEIERSETLIFTDTLYECADATAPTHYTKGTKIGFNRQIRSDLRSVPRERFMKKRAKDGTRCYIISFDLVISLKEGEMTFSLEMDGETMGSVEAYF